jgi:hypothetical protein
MGDGYNCFREGSSGGLFGQIMNNNWLSCNELQVHKSIMLTAVHRTFQTYDVLTYDKHGIITLVHRNRHQISYHTLRYPMFDIRDCSAFQIDFFYAYFSRYSVVLYDSSTLSHVSVAILSSWNVCALHSKVKSCKDMRNVRRKIKCK